MTHSLQATINFKKKTELKKNNKKVREPISWLYISVQFL